MRKDSLFIKTAFAVFIGLLSACSSDNDIVENKPVNPETPVSNSEQMTFSASMDAGNETRTDFNSNSTIWTESDAIKVLNNAVITATDQGSYLVGGAFNIVTHVGTAYTKEEVFTGSKIKSNGDGTDWFYAIYPTSCGIGYNDPGNDVVTIKNANVPAQQTAIKGSYSQSLHFMTAFSNNATFSFKNVCALLKITLKNYTGISKVKVRTNTISATNTNYIAGDFVAKINQTDGTTTNSYGGSSIQLTENSNRSVYVELPLPVSGDDCKEGTFYMVVLPMSIPNGFTLFVERTDGTKYMRVNTGLTKFERNKVYDLGVYDCTSTPTDMGVLENYVDLGLPSGTLWCTKNIKDGADNSITFVNDIYDDGSYYAWGELAEKEKYSSSTYTLGSEIYSGTLLKYKYDAANKIAGQLYCMPTYAQIYELYQNCTIGNYTSTAYNGHYGLMFTSKINKKTLWIPAAGYHCDQVAMSGLQSKGTKSHYWSRTLYSDNTDAAYCLDFNGANIDDHGLFATVFIGSGEWYDRRLCGKCIRPVVINKYLTQ